MMRAETEEVVVRPLGKTETESLLGCDFAAVTFVYGGKEGCFAIISRLNHKVIGYLLCPEEDINLFITKPERDKGFGSAALSLCLDLLFGTLGRKKITAVCPVDAITSVKTMEHCGFERVAEEDGKIHWEMTAANWELL